MSLVAYDRVRLFWGAFDAEHDIPAYAPGQRVSLGSSAVAGVGIGIRRAQLVFARAAPSTYAEDVAVMHFDFVNYTAGSPDDSWITADFTTLESAITSWWTTVKPMVWTNGTFREIRWYRIGHGVEKPNPAVRVQAVGVAGAGSVGMLPPQVAMSITNRTASRKHWGRTYLPDLKEGTNDHEGRIGSSSVDTVSDATHTLYTAAAAADFMPVVYCPSIGSALAIEQLSVDNIFDVIRSRRWQSTTYRKTHP